MIFWTPEGLIKKILLRQGAPDDAFWLAKDQMDMLPENAEVEMWAGELAPDEELDSESESAASQDNDEDGQAKSPEEAAKEFGKKDKRSYKKVALKVIRTDSDGKNFDATEYVPGGQLTILLQVGLRFTYYKIFRPIIIPLILIYHDYHHRRQQGIPL
jgi:hypothetical protein